jgi:hypothetical protein
MKKFLIMLSVFAFFFISSHSADSMCVYNDSEVKDLYVSFVCGQFCCNQWRLDPCPPGKPHTPGCYACRQDKDGMLRAPSIKAIIGCLTYADAPCATYVSNHGWVVIRGGTDEDNITCKAYR